MSKNRQKVGKVFAREFHYVSCRECFFWLRQRWYIPRTRLRSFKALPEQDNAFCSLSFFFFLKKKVVRRYWTDDFRPRSMCLAAFHTVTCCCNELTACKMSIFSQSAELLHERRPMASINEQLSSLFFFLFVVAWITQFLHGKLFVGFRRAKSTQRNTNFKKYFYRRSSPGWPHAGRGERGEITLVCN